MSDSRIYKNLFRIKIVKDLTRSSTHKFRSQQYLRTHTMYTTLEDGRQTSSIPRTCALVQALADGLRATSSRIQKWHKLHLCAYTTL